MATIDLNDLATFCTVAETGSFSVAAGRLGVPKSTVSRAVARLEAHLDVRLLHRTTRHVATSTAGAALYEKVAPHLHAVRRSVADLPEREEQPSGKLRVTASVDFGWAVLADLVARFVARHRAIEIDLRLTNDVVDLVAERIDVALRLSSGPLADSALVARKALPFRMQLFASPEYLARRGTPRAPRDLDEHEWIRFRAGDPITLESGGETATVVPRGRIGCDEMSFLRAVTLQGAGIAIIPSFLVDADVEAGRLVRVLPRWNVPSGSLWLVYPAGRHVPKKVSAFSEFVAEALKARKG